jgi:cytochrome bd-type quinol oxidase subunit 1
VDPDRQWLDAEPGRRPVQPDDHAHGDDRFYEVLFNEVAQAKFVHTVSAGYVTASVFVLGVSAWYLLKRPPYRAGPPLDHGGGEPSVWHRRSRWSCWAMNRAIRPRTARK